LAGKVTTGLVESNGSLPPGGWRKVTSIPGSALGPTIDNKYGKTLPFTYTSPIGNESLHCTANSALNALVLMSVCVPVIEVSCQ